MSNNLAPLLQVAQPELPSSPAMRREQKKSDVSMQISATEQPNVTKLDNATILGKFDDI
jgi:hypothetical protein